MTKKMEINSNIKNNIQKIGVSPKITLIENSEKDMEEYVLDGTTKYMIGEIKKNEEYFKNEVIIGPTLTFCYYQRPLYYNITKPLNFIYRVQEYHSRILSFDRNLLGAIGTIGQEEHQVEIETEISYSLSGFIIDLFMNPTLISHIEKMSTKKGENEKKITNKYELLLKLYFHIEKMIKRFNLWYFIVTQVISKEFQNQHFWISIKKMKHIMNQQISKDGITSEDYNTFINELTAIHRIMGDHIKHIGKIIEEILMIWLKRKFSKDSNLEVINLMIEKCMQGYIKNQKTKKGKTTDYDFFILLIKLFKEKKLDTIFDKNQQKQIEGYIQDFIIWYTLIQIYQTGKINEEQFSHVNLSKMFQVTIRKKVKDKDEDEEYIEKIYESEYIKKNTRDIEEDIKNSKKISITQYKNIIAMFNNLMDNVINNQLTINFEKMEKVIILQNQLKTNLMSDTLES